MDVLRIGSRHWTDRTSVCLIFLISPNVSAAVPSPYTWTPLEISPGWVAFDARALAGDSRAGGFVRLAPQQTTDPLDVATIWHPQGGYELISAEVGYYQAGVVGFSPEGKALGGARYSSSNTKTVPGFWIGRTFTPFQDFGLGGTLWAGNDSIFVGETGDLDSTGNFAGRASI